MLILCPSCKAEVRADVEECFSCGHLLQDTKVEEVVTSMPDLVMVEQEVWVEPRDLPIGLTIEGRFSIKSTLEQGALWAIYQVVDQEKGEELVLQMGGKNHPMVLKVISQIAVCMQGVHFPNVIAQGTKPAPFFVYPDIDGDSLRIWKQEYQEIGGRLLVIEQVLQVLAELFERGLTLQSFDPDRIVLAQQGFVLVHPLLIRILRRGETRVRNTLEWLDWILSDQLRSIPERGPLPLTGLSMRYAQWIRMMHRIPNCNPSRLRQGWSALQQNPLGRVSTMRARQLYQNIHTDFVEDGVDWIRDLDLQHIVYEYLVYGSSYCHGGKIRAKVDSAILAYEGLYFKPDVPEFEVMYNVLVLDQNQSFPPPQDVSQLLLQLKCELLLKGDWEPIFKELIARATSFDEWMELNYIRVLYHLDVQNIIVPKPENLEDCLSLASFFYWMREDDEETQRWIEEAFGWIVDSFDWLRYLEATFAFTQHADEQVLQQVWESSQDLPMKEKIILLEELEERLAIRREDWMSSILKRGTSEEVEWARSRFSTQKEQEEIALRLEQALENLLFFQIVPEQADWEDLEGLEQTFIVQLRFLERLQEESQRFEKEKFSPPQLQPPFSEESIVAVEEEFTRLYIARAERLARERKAAEQQDLRWILSLILVGAMCLLLV